MKKTTLKQRLEVLEDNEWSLNAMERLASLESFMREIRDGKFIVLPSRRYEALERKLKLVYQQTKEGKYGRAYNSKKKTVGKRELS